MTDNFGSWKIDDKVINVDNEFAQAAKEVVKEEKTKTDHRKCICGHTAQMHKKADRFAILKGRTKSKREIEALACADCECNAFSQPLEKKCKCGHTIKHHITKEVHIDGKVTVTHPCKYSTCQKYCLNFTEKVEKEETKERMRARNKARGWYAGPKRVETQAEKSARLIRESLAQNKEDGLDESEIE